MITIRYLMSVFGKNYKFDLSAMIKKGKNKIGIVLILTTLQKGSHWIACL